MPQRLAGFPAFTIAAMIMASSGAVAQPANSADPTGEWLVAERVARIQIVNCEDGRLWGVVSWEMNPGIDSKNPDPALRTRPTLGMPILLGMSQTKANQWDGQIYNSENGKTYTANISLVDAHTLRVRGCVFGFLCGGENWTRVETRLVDPKPPKPAARNPSSKPNSALASAPPETSEQICSRVLGVARPSHEGGLK